MKIFHLTSDAWDGMCGVRGAPEEVVCTCVFPLTHDISLQTLPTNNLGKDQTC